MGVQQSIIIFYFQTLMTSVFDHTLQTAWEQVPHPQEGNGVEVGLKEEEGALEGVYLNCRAQLLPYLIEVIKQFCLKYLDSASDWMIEDVLRKMSKVEGRMRKYSGLRELVAAMLSGSSS